MDVEGIGLCCSSSFQSYWISIYDGLICVGKGKYPFQNIVFQWLDSNPKCSVRYVGLSSWYKHVGYRNVNVLPVIQNHLSLCKQVDCGGDYMSEEYGGEENLEGDEQMMGYEKWDLEIFLESWELSDVSFVVGVEKRTVPARKFILASSGNFPLSSSQVVIELERILEAQLASLMVLSLQFEVIPLVKQCEGTMEQLKHNEELFDSGKSVELLFPIPSSSPHYYGAFPFGLPLDKQRPKQLNLTSEYSDVNVYIDGGGLVSQTHKIILSLWSVPFAKMFTNGMSETNSSEVLLKDVSPEAFSGMLDFMYSGKLDLEATTESGALLLQLFLLADQFGVILLHQECCKTLLEWLLEDTVCPILQVVSSVRSCKLIEETCERNFSAHFDYCTTASIGFVSLDETSFSNIILHPELTVTSEEKVLVAIFMWGMKAKELCGWEVVDELMTLSTPEVLFGKRLQSVHDFLSFVRFPIMPFALLKKLEKSNISRHIPTFEYLVKEAIGFIESGLTGMHAKHRRSSYKELQYICDGDSNGVLYFAGTSCGEHQWVNPVLAQETSFAGPRIENGHSSSWWMVDTGSNRQLMCDYYTLRQDGSRAYFRYWSLQGSLDGKTCTNLSLHENDQTVCKPGQFASWPIVGPNALRQLGPTADASNFSNLCICFLELYGYFH